jgi:NADH:ubiquinone oxidoreductase subunit 4 (subunit M)
MVVLRIFINYFNNLNFCIIIIISHSISSSILFIFNHIFYENFSSRIINKISSIFNFLTFTPWVFFILLLINISIPPRLNFFSEIFILKNILKFNLYFILLFAINFILRGIVSILLISKVIIIKENILNCYFKIRKIRFYQSFFCMIIIIILLIFIIKYI